RLSRNEWPLPTELTSEWSRTTCSVSSSVRFTPSDTLVPVLRSVVWSACESDVSSPTLAAPGTSSRASAASPWDERWADEAVPLAVACHGATWRRAGALSPVSSRAPPASPSLCCEPPVPRTGWPPTLMTAALASAADWSALAPVLDRLTMLLTWAAVAVAWPTGAGSAAAATGVRPMRRHAGAAAESMDRRMVLLSRPGARLASLSVGPRRALAYPRRTLRETADDGRNWVKPR